MHKKYANLSINRYFEKNILTNILWILTEHFILYAGKVEHAMITNLKYQKVK